MATILCDNLSLDPVSARLIKCFSHVFPDLRGEDIARAAAGDVPEWDSLATVNLLALIEEEFGIRIDLDDLEQAPSFQSLRERIPDQVR